MHRSIATAQFILTAAVIAAPALLHNSAIACGPPIGKLECPGDAPPIVLQSDVLTGELIDPAGFFQKVVDRYRTLGAYEDTMHVVEVTEHAGREVQRRESDMRCEINDDGELSVRTPTKSLLDELGWKLPLAHSKSMQETKRRLDLWLAPHLGLRYLENPLQDFRQGVEKGFTAKSAKTVKVNDRPMVQIELASDDIDNDSNDGADASFDLYIDPESMLVERIEGRQQFDDGSTCQTTLEINPGNVRDDRGEMIRQSREVVNAQSPDATPGNVPAQREGEQDYPRPIQPADARPTDSK